jgi:acetyl esterase/lipase
MRLILILIAALVSAVAQAQAPPEMAEAISLGTGPVPDAIGSEIWSGKAGQLSVRNVVEATLLPVLPASGKANGSAMIVAPGGAFMTLAWSGEGMAIARALAERGVTAFVLKYRVVPTPRPWPEFGKVMARQMTNWIAGPGGGIKVETPGFAVDDAVAAVRLARTNASRWGIDPNRVGMIGFSAGARLTLATMAALPASEQLAVAVVLYPPMAAISPPPKAPPMFVAMATNDPLSGKSGYGLVQSWIDAGRPVEFHAFQTGGHGFGLGLKATTSNGWIALLWPWLDGQHFAQVRP